MFFSVCAHCLHQLWVACFQTPFADENLSSCQAWRPAGEWTDLGGVFFFWWLSVQDATLSCVLPFVLVGTDASAGARRVSRAPCGPIGSVLLLQQATTVSVGDGAQLEIWKGRQQAEGAPKAQRPCGEAPHAREGRPQGAERRPRRRRGAWVARGHLSEHHLVFTSCSG